MSETVTISNEQFNPNNMQSNNQSDSVSDDQSDDNDEEWVPEEVRNVF